MKNEGSVGARTLGRTRPTRESRYPSFIPPKNDLERFKTFRDKAIAHSEHGVNIENLPPYAAMEELFDFGGDFYSLIATTFFGVHPFDIKTHIKQSFERVLHRLGLTSTRTNME